MTQRFPLTDQAWTDLGPTPLELQALGGNDVLYVVASSSPTDINADAELLSQFANQTKATETQPGMHVYARAARSNANVVVSSPAAFVAPSADQDPIFDHANGTKTSVTASATIITPPTGCKYLRISSDVDIFVNTAGNAAVDDGTSIRVVANTPEVIPVVAGTAVKALSSSGTAVVRCTPMKVR